uniref:Nucleoside diphosphate kinase B n=1 Tax=Cynoglossus semilaevis TaxID=244447 RepID=A0A3P8VYA6_CYNSE
MPDFETFPGVYVERTPAIIKPDAIHKSEEIEDFKDPQRWILQKRRLQLTQCRSAWEGHLSQVDSLHEASGLIIALTLARTNAIAHWKSLTSQVTDTKFKETETKSLRAKYGTSEKSEREIKFMFPNCIIEATPSKESTQENLSRYVNPANQKADPITLRYVKEPLCRKKNPEKWKRKKQQGMERNPHPVGHFGATGVKKNIRS